MDQLMTEFTPPEDCRFFKNAQGFLGLELRGTVYGRVQVTRALPLAAPERYLCVTDMSDKEIAALEDLAAFDEQSQALLREELGVRYFVPEVTQVNSIKEKMGSYFVELRLGAYEKTVAVKDISKNLRQLGGGRLVLIDVDGNRYAIPDVYAIRKKSLRMLEPYLY